MEKLFYFNLDCNNANQAIEAIGKLMVENDLIHPNYIKSMQKRNQQVSVYMGQGLAIPHGLDNSDNLVKKEALVIARLKNSILWNVDDKDTETFVIIGIVAKRDSQIHILQSLAVKFMNENFLNKLLKSSEKKFKKYFQ